MRLGQGVLTLALPLPAPRLVCPLLGTHIGTSLLPLAAHGRAGLPVRPAVCARDVALSSTHLTCPGAGTCPLQYATRRGYRRLWREREAARHVLRHPGACHAPPGLLARPRMAEGAQGFPESALEGLASPLGDTHAVILAMPPRRRQALKGVCHGFSVGVLSSSHRGRTRLPERAKRCSSHWANQWLTSKAEVTPALRVGILTWCLSSVCLLCVEIRYRGLRTIGTTGGASATWILPRGSNPCRSYKRTFSGLVASR